MHELPATPFIFNDWKHHKIFVKRKIEQFIIGGSKELPVLQNELKNIGDSRTDFYYGNLEPFEITKEIENILLEKEIFKRSDYIIWLNKNKLMYKLIELSDGSLWTLRLGENAKQYIHFHPGRRSVYSIRIKASILKTAIAALVWSGIYLDSPESRLVVNEARQKLLILPPVKNISDNKGILRIIELLKN